MSDDPQPMREQLREAAIRIHQLESEIDDLNDGSPIDNGG